MRISQIKTLCWTANVLVLAGAGYVAVHFGETFKRRRIIPEIEWPDEGGGDVIQKRWPGEVTGFRMIWDTPVNGLVPKPPAPPAKVEVEKDLGKIFLGKYTYHTSIDTFPELDESVAYVEGPGSGAVTMLRTGESIDGFTLIGFEASTERGEDALVFSNPKVDGLVRMKRSEDPLQNLTTPPLVRALADNNDLAQPEVDLMSIPRRAYQDLLADPSGLTWHVPAGEVYWWGAFGEDDVLAKLVVNVAKDAGGNAMGIKLMSQPGAGTAVSDGRGLMKGDIIKSINGVPTRSKEEIVLYLRGDGQGLGRYEVLVENETGVERTLVYEVERARRRSPSR